ncbi:hybrid sensor histidine kinase/response regulator [Hymenobacter glacieicola]|uniref:histidine kinase n=1 Tax=Hymenobacter glacieicola TaxID=1562124 RepID=A0ABQ1WK78_9BACT|nr:hybrid sensor histidine kinase/response regulator [Hymenobacter glacieicola]GGG30968.1 hypothetical protein GCM10011378_04480 [Hymenobacter glacieicola]
MRFCRWFVLLCLYGALFSPAATAQLRPAQRFVKQFGAADGLPQPFIYALAQDRAGYLWIGTAEGLVRFDGAEFVTFTTAEGLAEDFVTRLYVHPRTGQLWIGHYQGAVSRWHGQRLQRVSARAARAAGFSASRGIAPPDTGVAAAPGAVPLQRVLPPGTVPQCVLTDREHNVWVGTAGQGLWRWSDRQVTFYPFAESPATGTVQALFSQREAFGMLSTGQLFRLEQSPERTSPLLVFPDQLLPYPPSVVLQTPDQRVHPVFGGSYPRPAPTYLWAGTTGHGLWQTQLPTDQRKPLMRRVRRLPAESSITALAQHPSGDLWIGTALDGLYRLPADSVQPAEHFTTANGLLHNTIYALTTDSVGQVWVGTHDTGLAVWHQGRFRHYRLNHGGLDVSALLTDDKGRVWIGTEGHGVFCYEKGQFRQYKEAAGLLSPYCYALLPVRRGSGYPPNLREGQLLVVHRNGLSLADSARRFTPAALPGNPFVRDLLPQAAVAWSDYSIWVLTRTGLLCLRPDSPNLLPGTSAPTPTLLTSEVDGAARLPYRLGELSATQHRVNFRFRGVSLLPGQAGVQYQYRLRGYHAEWSRPTTVGEAQFPRLDAGEYAFEVRARLGEQGRWSRPTVSFFQIATPFWQTWWFAGLSVLVAGAAGWAFVRGREITLRRQKLQLETTVRERTAELRQQKAQTEQINADLVVARDAAEASRRAKAQFLANMSHEIRTPMNAVIGLTHLLRNTPVDAEQGEYLEAIQSSSQNLLVIINDILDSSKMEAGKLTLEQAPFRLPELVERVARMFQFATEAKGLYLRTEVAPNVPAAILGDSVRLNQVLVNLVGNAIKFTTRGGVRVRVSVTAEMEVPQLRFAVQDTGIGIAADKLDAIFEDFSQANASTTRQYGGTGLGLSIARNLVHLHGGRVWVESAEGQGSTFWFEIPCLPADEASVRPEASASLAPFEPALRVLVAEDNDLNQLVARKTLEAWNVRVTIAANGRLAVAAAQQQPFDAVLLDVQMPEMDGYEAARQLRMLFPNAERLPLIGLTASALPEDRALALAAGMNDTLAKPFDPAVLYARLAYFTGRTEVPNPAPTSLPPAPASSSRPSVPATQPPDWSLLEELAGGNEAFVQQIVRTFLTQAPDLLAQLHVAASGAEVAALAHKLRGQVAYFGVEGLAQQLEQLEHQGRAGSGPGVLSEPVKDIEQQLTSLYPQLQRRLSQSIG